MGFCGGYTVVMYGFDGRFIGIPHSQNVRVSACEHRSCPSQTRRLLRGSKRDLVRDLGGVPFKGDIGDI